MNLSIPNNILERLTYSHYSVPTPINVLLGIRVFFQLFIFEKIKIFNNMTLEWIFTSLAPVLSAEVLYVYWLTSDVLSSFFEKPKSIC